MSDISTVDEAIACREAGADCVSTTLCGYTPYTMKETKHGPSLEILRNCVKALPDCPVFAEGRYNTPVEAGKRNRKRCLGSRCRLGHYPPPPHHTMVFGSSATCKYRLNSQKFNK